MSNGLLFIRSLTSIAWTEWITMEVACAGIFIFLIVLVGILRISLFLQSVLCIPLIKKGGGTGPVMPWQPAYCKVPIPVPGYPEIDKSDSMVYLLIPLLF